MNARINNTLTVTTLAAILLPVSISNAAITGVSGQTTWLGVSPASCVPGALTGFNAFTWDEQQNAPLFQPVNMINNPGTSSSPTPGAVGGNFDSHFIHFEGIPGVIGATGTVSFSQPIAAVIFRALDLDTSDAPVGAGGTLYPTTYPFRGLNAASIFSISGNTLSFNFISQTPTMDVVQVRVLTHPVPAPAGAALLGGAGLIAARRRRA